MYDFGEPIATDSLLFEETIHIGLIAMILTIIAFVIHIVFALAIFKDASGRKAEGRTVWFVQPIFWAGATCIGSVFVAAIYCAMHYSTLAGTESPSSDESDAS